MARSKTATIVAGQLSLFNTRQYERVRSHYDIEDGYEAEEIWPPKPVSESSLPLVTPVIESSLPLVTPVIESSLPLVTPVIESGDDSITGRDNDSISRLKNSIKPIENALALILKSNPVRFRYTAKIRNQTLFGDLQERHKPHYGFIAQDFPIDELVTEKADGEKGINYLEIIPFLVGAIQELQKQIDDLKKVTN